MRWLFGVVLAVILSVAGRAEAATPGLVGSFQDWNVYALDQGSGRLCYAASEPKKQDGNYKRRGPAAVIVARLPGESGTEQVSVQPGYSYKEGSNVRVTVDGQEFSLFTKGEHAWTNSSKEDAALIAAMQAGKDLTVRGTSTRDTWSLDTYSLLGFTAAHKAMRDACGSA